MYLSLLWEYRCSTDEIWGARHIWSTQNFSICYVKVESFVGQTNFLATLNCWMIAMLVICRFHSTENEYLFAGDLETSRIKESKAVIFWNVIYELPLVLLDFKNFYIANELKWLVGSHILDISSILKPFSTKNKNVLVIKRADPETLSWMIHWRNFTPLIILYTVHFTASQAFYSICRAFFKTHTAKDKDMFWALLINYWMISSSVLHSL